MIRNQLVTRGIDYSSEESELKNLFVSVGTGLLSDAQQHSGQVGDRPPVRADGNHFQRVQAETEAD